MDLACTVVCPLAQQLQLPESTCVGRDLRTFSRTGQWALIIQPSGLQITPDVTCAVKAATQIRVMNSAHFILSYRVLNSLSSFIYNKQTHVYVYTHTLLPLYAVPHPHPHPHPLTPQKASLNLLLWKSIVQLLHASPLWDYYLHSYLILVLLAHLTCFSDIYNVPGGWFLYPYHECHDYVWREKPGSSRMGSNYALYTLYPLHFILMIAVEWEAKSLNKEIYNKLGQVWWGKCSCGTNISINQFKSTGEFLRDSFAGHKCWPYVVSMYRNLPESNITKYRLELRNSFI